MLHTSYHLETWQWILAALACAAVGVSKTGIAGLGVLAVATFALVLPSRQSVGALLPILICGDIVAVALYRRHAVWSHLLRLFPWAAIGIVLGYLAMGRINDKQVAHVIGGILVVLVVLQAARRWQAHRRASIARSRQSPGSEVADPDEISDNEEVDPVLNHPVVAALLGILAGFTTMVANAAGPIVILYLLAMRLPKLEFMGTSAWYYLALNVFKVPFSVQLGLINADSIPLDLALAPCTIGGAVIGRYLLRHIDQQLFESLALVLTVVAAGRLLWTH